MTEMDESLRRARRALRDVADEMAVTWDDVLARSEATETAPVVPPAGGRPAWDAAVRLAVAAGLVVAVAAGAALVGQRLHTQPPASPGPSTVASHPGPTSSAQPDEAQVVVDQTRQALADLTWCGVSLVSRTPRAALYLDADLSPAALLTTDVSRGRTPDGTLVTVDDRMRTWQELSSEDELTAGYPALEAASQALRSLATGGGPWQLAQNGTAVSTPVGGEPVAAAVDAGTGLPVSVTVPSAAGAIAVAWIPCDETMSKATRISLPVGYADVSR